MNKEYEADWEQPVAAGSAETAASRQQGRAMVKQIVTIRLDVDILEWFKLAGPGYQTRINQVLREHMEARRS
jgi:uncharacterized protein (DUF4415 family)